MNYIESDYKKALSDFQRKGRINKCFYCGKETNIIKSHSISEKKCLDLLVESVGKRKGVYGFKHLLLSYTNWYNPYNFADFEIVGLKEASTFKGFCRMHDQDLFKEIDEQRFEEGSLKQYFLYCYRAFAKAVHSKSEELKSCNSHSLYREQYYEYITKRSHDIEIGLNLDLFDYKKKMNKWLKEADYSHLEHFHCKTQTFHPLATASFCQPSFTINNNRINDYTDDTKPLNHIFINIIPEKERTNVLFSCFRDQPLSMRFLTELKDVYEMDKYHFGRFLTALLIIHTENTFLAPSLIEALSMSERLNLLSNLRNAVTQGIVEQLLDTPIDINEYINLFNNKF